MALLTISLRFLLCLFQVRFSSTIVPRYLTFWTRLIDAPFMFTSTNPGIRLV